MNTDDGRLPAGRATHEQSPQAGSAVPVGIADAIWLIWASEGEYSDRSEWPVVAAPDEATGEALCLRIGALWRHLCQQASEHKFEDWAVRKAKNEAIMASPEGLELTHLTGETGGLDAYDAEDRQYYCCKVRMLPAQGMSAEGENSRSEVEGEARQPGQPQADAPKGQPND